MENKCRGRNISYNRTRWNYLNNSIIPTAAYFFIYSTPCNSIDGTIYFGTNIGETDGGELIAINPDGTEKWRECIANLWVESAPAIAEDGTVYIGSSWQPTKGYLHAFGELDPNAPEAPTITGETDGKAGAEYEYTFSTIDPNGDDVFFNIDWGDGEFEDWFGPYNSGEEVVVSHTWDEQGTYTIKARAKDTDNLWGPWATLEVKMPINQPVQYPLLELFRERFPLLYQIMFRVLEELNI